MGDMLDSFGNAVDRLLTRSAEAGEIIRTARAVEQLEAELANSSMSAAEMAEAIIRAAAHSK